MGGPSSLPPSFKTWEHGAPHLAVEIVSSSDGRDRDREAKLERYRHSGIGEVVFFDPDDDQRPLRIWDLVEWDLAERDPLLPEGLR
jgi:Uma2 family endonuclease